MIINRNNKGFTLVEIMIVVAIIGLLAAIAVPNFVQARNAARSSTCINNLRLIDSAKEQYAIENNVASGGAATSADIVAYLKGGAMPTCPSAGAYTINNVGTLPVCSLSGSASGMTPKSHRLD
ncbi:MAG: type II secretion system protein [Candidatus Omnitrophica bacterium]|nr:type II secretion system protein [Candidatus Omnitrophota bacterium]